MLLSMTGYGEAHICRNGRTILCEVKTVNNRYLKTTLRIPDNYSFLESVIESYLKKQIDRGTVTFSLKILEGEPGASSRIQISVLKEYLNQAERCRKELTSNDSFPGLTVGSVSDFLRLPGVVQDFETAWSDSARGEIQSQVLETIDLAFERLQETRRREGESMFHSLNKNSIQLKDEIARIEELAPLVVENWRLRLTERIGKILAEQGVALSPNDLVREVALFTDKADISEEIVRFRSHLDQFERTMTTEKLCGKKLDFLTQEMFRETNTIGAKANSPEISLCVVSMKNGIERIREMVQNIE